MFHQFFAEDWNFFARRLDLPAAGMNRACYYHEELLKYPPVTASIRLLHCFQESGSGAAGADGAREWIQASICPDHCRNR